MSLSRREILGLGVAASLGTELVGCSRIVARVSARPGPTTLEVPFGPEDRILNRLAFGSSGQSIARLRSLGAEGYISEQLKAEPVFDIQLAARLRHLEALEIDAAELRDLSEEEVLRQLQAATIISAVYSPNQLLERMVDFWSNHFNIYARKEQSMYRIAVDQRKTIRKHALGKFPEMLMASAKSTAMLVYLDNQLNRKGVPNENYARELMELHTLGVNGGYTQSDVKEVARCFTGWTMENRLLRPRGQFRFDSDLHDSGVKEILGHTISADGGQEDGERVIELLANHPATARFISHKLCRYFLGDAGVGLEAEVARAYQDSGGTITAMLKPILASEALFSGPPILKRPFDYLVSAVRRVEADTDGSQAIQQHLERMGQPLFQWPMPDGYPDKTAAWTGSLLSRWNFAVALCKGDIAGTTVRLDRTVATVKGASSHDPALVLCAPGFQWR